MWRLSLLSRVLKSSSSCKPTNQGLPFLLHDPSKAFCTGTQVPQQEQEPSLHPVQQTRFRAPFYGRLVGFGSNSLKTDIAQFFGGCNLTTDDIKVEYDRVYSPVGMVLQFPSGTAFDMAIRTINRTGRLYRLDRVDRGYWDVLTTYNGKVVLLQGIPRNALAEDVERFLSGCNFDASNIQLLMRPGFPDPIRFALIPFPSQTEALNAFRLKNRGFCLNNQITMRVLQ